MKSVRNTKPIRKKSGPVKSYRGILNDVADVLEKARRAAARSVNSVMTAAYWEIGRRIVEHEQGGRRRAGYGSALLERLSADLTRLFGRGYGVDNLELFRAFYLTYPAGGISPAIPGKSESMIRISSGFSDKALISESPIRKSPLQAITPAFPLPWTHYIHLVRRTRSSEARRFYETEALRGGWTVRQLDRQIQSQFYERATLSRNKSSMLKKGGKPLPRDSVTADEEIRNPLILEFLGLRDEYSESDLEQSLIRSLESFLLELGNDFTFVGRQRRLRIDDEWFRVDLLFFHRRLRCLVLIDLKLGRFTHADAGQMHMYLNYASEHWTQPGENPPVGVILCSGRGESLARYATDGLPNKTVVREYLTALPDEKVLRTEMEKARRRLQGKNAST